MTNLQRQAHKRLMSTLPVRTHLDKEAVVKARTRAECRELKAVARDLRKRGLRVKQIAAQMEIPYQAVQRFLRDERKRKAA